MENENLKNALKTAGLTAEEFADIVRVDPKSVHRWLAGTSIPHPRRRVRIARALDLTEQQLWPDQTPSTSNADPGAEDDDVVSEVTGTWTDTAEQNAPELIEFILEQTGDIDLLDDSWDSLLNDRLVRVLASAAASGRRIRLLAYPSRPRTLEPLVGQAQIEFRVFSTGCSYSLLRVGDAMLFTINLADEGDQLAPLLKLQRVLDGGLFDRLANNFEILWNDADGTITTLAQLYAFHTSSDEDDDLDEGNEEPTGFRQPSDRTGPKPSPTTDADHPLTPNQPAATGRRWPRRPA